MLSYIFSPYRRRRAPLNYVLTSAQWVIKVSFASASYPQGKTSRAGEGAPEGVCGLGHCPEVWETEVPVAVETSSLM